MTLGSYAVPPAPYVALCARQPMACGDDLEATRAAALRAEAELAALASGAPMDIGAAAVPPAARGPAAEAPMTAELAAILDDVNRRVNRAIRPVKDHPARDRWSLPLADGRRAGDCEDYALEKLRALVARGVPRAVLNLATAHTTWGENHAVLLVATSEGEFVLDNLDPKVRRWDETSYRWGKRQVNGAAFDWVMVRNRPAAAGD